VERIWLDVYEDNARGRHVYERIGFSPEAILRRGVFRQGRYVDVHRMAVLRGEWPSSGGGAAD
jgi:RimJ/RimL family protein N-acetyltransferase